MYITIPYSPGFFLKSCTCLFSGMKFQPVRDKYTLPPTNILYPKKHPFLLGYRIPFFSDANYVCSMMSTSFKGWVCGGSKKKHREHDAGGILEVEKKTVKSQISDVFFPRLNSICLPILVEVFVVLGGTIFHIPPPDQTTLYDRIFSEMPSPTATKILKKRIIQGLLFLPHGSV